MPDLLRAPGPSAPSSRRDFLKLLGVGGAVLGTGTALAGCDSSDPSDPDPPDPAAVTLDFSSDFGVLNYAYALEQLEAAFYAAVITDGAFGSIFSADEQAVLRDLERHEAIHRDFYAAVLGDMAIPGLTPDFSAVDFDDRDSVLATAQTFEDLGVAAYNGAGRYFSDTDDGRTFLTIAGKIVSVEARHASVVSGIITQNAIAAPGVVDADTGLDRAFTPSVVLGADGAGPFIQNEITAVNT